MLLIHLCTQYIITRYDDHEDSDDVDEVIMYEPGGRFEKNKKLFDIFLEPSSAHAVRKRMKKLSKLVAFSLHCFDHLPSLHH